MSEAGCIEVVFEQVGSGFSWERDEASDSDDSSLPTPNPLPKIILNSTAVCGQNLTEVESDSIPITKPLIPTPLQDTWLEGPPMLHSTAILDSNDSAVSQPWSPIPKAPSPPIQSPSTPIQTQSLPILTPSPPQFKPLVGRKRFLHGARAKPNYPILLQRKFFQIGLQIPDTKEMYLKTIRLHEKHFRQIKLRFPPVLPRLTALYNSVCRLSVANSSREIKDDSQSKIDDLDDPYRF